MTCRSLLVIVGLCGLVFIVAGCGACGGGHLAVLQTFIGGGQGKWDYLTVDPDARRVYVARETRIMVFDADRGNVIGEVEGINGAHGIAIVPQRHVGYATSGKEAPSASSTWTASKSRGSSRPATGPTPSSTTPTATASSPSTTPAAT